MQNTHFFYKNVFYNDKSIHSIQAEIKKNKNIIKNMFKLKFDKIFATFFYIDHKFFLCNF
jgi:poly(3-hydroxyalkanoate) synthetase